MEAHAQVGGAQQPRVVVRLQPGGAEGAPPQVQPPQPPQVRRPLRALARDDHQQPRQPRGLCLRLRGRKIASARRPLECVLQLCQCVRDTHTTAAQA